VKGALYQLSYPPAFLHFRVRRGRAQPLREPAKSPRMKYRPRKM